MRGVVGYTHERVVNTGDAVYTRMKFNAEEENKLN
jgi:hypothetical protein